MYSVTTPETKLDFKHYYHFRWQMLRAPWQQAAGSEQDDLETNAIHRMIKNEHGEVIAVGRLHKTSQSQAKIRYMAVADSCQGKGLGKLIINALEQEAIKQGVNEIELNAREVALTFYLKLGYQQIEKSHVLYDEIQHFRMLKNLLPQLPGLAEELTETWHNTIPMSKAMNIEVCYFDNQQLFTSCDLAFNKNLHNTMFAGSIYTLATLTGWGWVYLLLQQVNLKGSIVLAHGEIKYLAPVAGCGVGYTDSDLVTGDLGSMQITGKARLSIEVQIRCGDKVAAQFLGQYVVIAEND